MDPRLACRHSSSHGDPEKEKRIEIELLGSTVTSFLCLHFDSAKLKWEDWAGRQIRSKDESNKFPEKFENLNRNR